RLFVTDNFFSHVPPRPRSFNLLVSGSGSPLLPPATKGGTPPAHLILSLPPNADGEPVSLHRDVIGLEDTFFGGNASFGLRMPYIQLGGEPNFRNGDFGDLTLIFKYACINNCKTGNVLSTGLAVTLPTGTNSLLPDTPAIHTTLLQPYVGF